MEISLTIQWFLFLFSINLAPLKFSSLAPLHALETAWRPSLHFLRQFGAPGVFFPGAPACTWNCIMAPLSSFSPSIWSLWRFLPWSPCLHLKLHCASLVLFSVNLAPLTFSSLELVLALETAWHPSRPFLRQFGAPDVFFPGPLLALETAWRPSRPFLRQFGAPDVFFPGALACTWNCLAPLSSYWFNFRSFVFLSCSLFLPFFLSYSLLFLFFPLFSLLSFTFLFFLSFWCPFGDPGAQAPKAPPPRYTPGLYCTPKIHKPNNPLRPIVDYTATIGYNTSRWLADILGGLVGNTQHHVKNSKLLADELATVVLEDDEILNSHDVVSLFTNTPIDQVLDIVQRRLENEDVLKVYNKDTGFNLTNGDVVQLSDFILSTTYFTFRGKKLSSTLWNCHGKPSLTYSC